MNRRTLRMPALLAVTALLLAACGSGFESEEPSVGAPGSEAPEASAGGSAAAEPGADLTILIGSSGDAETDIVNKLVADWSAESGVEAEVVVASDLNQQLSQGFSSNNPPDLFYLSTDQMAAYAATDSLEPYAENLSNADDFFPALREAFTYNGQFMCAPKDFSTLALIINSDMWADAGLTDDDIPTTWDELSAVAAQLTTDEHKGLAFGPEVQRVGVFMAEAGGRFIDDDGTTAVVDSPENVEALQYVKDQMAAGDFAFSNDPSIDAGWGGEAFGLGKAAMVIEGNWIAGAMTNDFPDVNYQVAELPEGPGGPGTIQYTNCWGMAALSDNIPGATSLVEYLTSAESQLAAAEAFGVMPSVESAAEDWKAAYPEFAAFIDGADYAINLPSQPGTGDVIADFNAQLATLSSTEPEAILASVQASLQDALDSQ
ncbi:MAG TPA: extracellular solute-binding protein [Candidatus Limnocylindria bacterium]|nr:extracellular solute-binding protein [Candidatus Limnocylindria bacterium]